MPVDPEEDRPQTLMETEEEIQQMLAAHRQQAKPTPGAKLPTPTTGKPQPAITPKPGAPKPIPKPTGNMLPVINLINTPAPIPAVKPLVAPVAAKPLPAAKVEPTRPVVSKPLSSPDVELVDESPGQAKIFRPTRRPPVPMLTVLDDGLNTGEVIRIRQEKLIIGRTEGDLILPHDDLISTRHLEITRQFVNGKYRWVLTDLNSRNGLFIRISKCRLTNGNELLVGSGRYRFECHDPQDSKSNELLATVEESTDQTLGWQGGAPLRQLSAITELIPNGIGNRVLLSQDEYWIGADSQCSLARPSDEYCEQKHCRIFWDGTDWVAENHSKLNGVYHLKRQFVVEHSIKFQIGEQRFEFKI